MVCILFDAPKVGWESFLVKNMGEPVKDVYSDKWSPKMPVYGWFIGALKALMSTKKNDVVICWFDFQAILVYWLALLLNKRRKIVCINVLLKEKNTLKNKIVTYLYKKALNSNNVVASVTSVEYGERLKTELNIKRDFFLLHDIFHGEWKKYTNKNNIHSKSVFCGGHNGRDWNFIIELACNMPDVNFNLVMPKNLYKIHEATLPDNVCVKYNIPFNEFMAEMCKSAIVALPLDTEAPAGLTVMFQAAANMKYILTTDTITTREYLSDGRGCLLPNDVAMWTKAIEERLELGGQEALNNSASTKLLHFLESECSKEKYVQGIKSMIKRVRI